MPARRPFSSTAGLVLLGAFSATFPALGGFSFALKFAVVAATMVLFYGAPVALGFWLGRIAASAILRAGTRVWRTAAAFSVIVLAVFLPAASVWGFVLITATQMGECAYEEVRCSPTSEFLSLQAAWSFPVLVAIVLGLALWQVRGLVRRARTTVYRGS